MCVSTAEREISGILGQPTMSRRPLMVKKTPVKTFRERLFCDTCGKEMESDGFVLTSSPPQYRHVCLGCGRAETIRGKAYPRIVYEEATDAE
jgi:hypothetical protein